MFDLDDIRKKAEAAAGSIQNASKGAFNQVSEAANSESTQAAWGSMKSNMIGLASKTGGVLGSVGENFAATASTAASSAHSSVASVVENAPTVSAPDPSKVMRFMGCFCMGLLCMFMSLWMLPMLVVAPQKFCLMFSLGSGFILYSFSILKGHAEFLAHMSEMKRLPYSLSYVLSLLGTLWASLIAKSTLYTIIFALIQIATLAQFLGSYVPGGVGFVHKAFMGWISTMKFFFGMASRASSMADSSYLPV